MQNILGLEDLGGITGALIVDEKVEELYSAKYSTQGANAPHMKYSWAWFLILLIIAVAQRGAANELAIGKTAQLDGEVQIPIYPPVNLNFQSRAAIYKSRTQYVMTQPKLLKGKYSPSDEVFGQIAGGRPWWGLLGQAYYDSGPHSIDGPAEESRFIMNPFLLVADGNAGMIAWDKSKVTEQRAKQPGFPTYCKPQDLKWYPKEGRAEVTYPASAFESRCNSINGTVSDKHGRIQLAAYNARDLGLPWLFIPMNRARNISMAQMAAPKMIPQYIHCGGSCGYPGGCNNMSPTSELDSLEFTSLPARLEIWLWKKQPRSWADKPDMTWVMHYR